MIVFYYIAGFAAFLSLLLAWFSSDLPIYLCNKIFNKEFSKYWQVVDFIGAKSEFLENILGCRTCFGTYLAIFVSSFMSIIGGLGFLFVFLSIGWLLPVIFFDKLDGR